jgi:hypothetical protein
VIGRADLAVDARVGARLRRDVVDAQAPAEPSRSNRTERDRQRRARVNTRPNCGTRAVDQRARHRPTPLPSLPATATAPRPPRPPGDEARTAPTPRGAPRRADQRAVLRARRRAPRARTADTSGAHGTAVPPPQANRPLIQQIANGIPQPVVISTSSNSYPSSADHPPGLCHRPGNHITMRSSSAPGNRHRQPVGAPRLIIGDFRVIRPSASSSRRVRYAIDIDAIQRRQIVRRAISAAVPPPGRRGTARASDRVGRPAGPSPDNCRGVDGGGYRHPYANSILMRSVTGQCRLAFSRTPRGSRWLVTATRCRRGGQGRKRHRPADRPLPRPRTSD